MVLLATGEATKGTLEFGAGVVGILLGRGVLTTTVAIDVGVVVDVVGEKEKEGKERLPNRDKKELLDFVVEGK